MFKRLILVLSFMAIGLVTSYAAENTTGKVIALEKNQIQITVDGEMPTWCHKGRGVMLLDEAGKAIVRRARVIEQAETNITVRSNSAGNLKVGDTVTLQKSRVSSGC